jgi:hypothetical protein
VDREPALARCNPPITILFLISSEAQFVNLVSVTGSTRCILLIFLLVSLGTAQTSEQKTAHYFDSIRHQPPLLLAFLHDMPKGGDLHSHLSGAVYAEDSLDFAISDGFCVDRTTSQLIAPPCDSCEKYTAKPAARCAYDDHVLYNQIIDAWSMRNWRRSEESGHDHFFATFDKFGLTSHNHTADMIASVINRAATEHVQYVEFMNTPDGGAALRLAKDLGWKDDLPKMREGLLSGGLKQIAAATTKTVAETDAQVRAKLKCGTQDAEPGCRVTVRYLYQVLRGLPPESVFAQILLGFELASTDSRFVGLNLVMPEDWYVPIHDFSQHMAMLDYLHGIYPKVHISLHAGELAEGLVKPEDLGFHIRASVERGHAERIGHGVDIMNEKDPIGLMKEMAARNILVEINLTSNDQILGISGDEHPLPVYMKYGVPVAISTDDEGVARSDMTHEYLRAVEGYRLSYAELKRMTRQSLEHSFLPGESLWRETKPAFRMAAACAGDAGGAEKPSSMCAKFLDASEHAREQWRLEAEFSVFEKTF